MVSVTTQIVTVAMILMILLYCLLSEQRCTSPDLEIYINGYVTPALSHYGFLPWLWICLYWSGSSCSIPAAGPTLLYKLSSEDHA